MIQQAQVSMKRLQIAVLQITVLQNSKSRSLYIPVLV